MRTYRLLAIVMILLNRNKVSAGKLAEEFEVSPRTIYRDIETICQAGIPIVSHQGAGGGFSILENYKVSKNFFTPDEILSILTALKGLNSSLDDDSIKLALEKVKNIFPDKNDINNGNHSVVMDLNHWGNNKESREKINLIKTAINQQKIISMEYINSSHKKSSRKIEPITLVLRGGLWYLYSFCRLREDYRIFRISRIINIKITKEKFYKNHKSFNKFESENSWNSSEEKATLELLFQPGSLLYIQDYFLQEQIEQKEDGSYLVRVNYPEDDWLYGFILSFGDMVEVINPPHIRKIIKQKASRIIEKY